MAPASVLRRMPTHPDVGYFSCNFSQMCKARGLSFGSFVALDTRKTTFGAHVTCKEEVFACSQCYLTSPDLQQTYTPHMYDCDVCICQSLLPKMTHIDVCPLGDFLQDPYRCRVGTYDPYRHKRIDLTKE